MSTLQAPQINMNGTSAHELIEQYQNALDKLNAAIKALQQTVPHGRDYQTISDGAYLIARKQHSARIFAVNDVREEIAQLIRAIDDR